MHVQYSSSLIIRKPILSFSLSTACLHSRLFLYESRASDLYFERAIRCRVARTASAELTTKKKPNADVASDGGPLVHFWKLPAWANAPRFGQICLHGGSRGSFASFTNHFIRIEHLNWCTGMRSARNFSHMTWASKWWVTDPHCYCRLRLAP